MLYDKRWELDPISRTLLAAADYMEEHGWCSNGARGPNEEICLVVAISRTFPNRRTFEDDRVCWEAHARLQAHLAPFSIIGWNTHVCRSKEQAVMALRGAAFAEGQREGETKC